jgi:tRNA pseudouridine(55) synthase
VLPSGALLIDKPDGMTSSQVVSKIKWALIQGDYAPKGFKIGHGGTLDPFAIGALIIFIGEGTKLADTYLHSIKAYDGIITLGVETDTADLTGKIKNTAAIPDLSEAVWQRFAAEFVDQAYSQVPPMFSAKKRDGTPLYELARAGVEIEREAILKKIYSFTVEKSLVPNELHFRVQCESGTYVRTLAEDLAKKAGTLAHLKTLRRIQSSDIRIEDCVSLEKTLGSLQAKTPLHGLKNFKALRDLGTHIPSLAIDSESCEQLWNGVQSETEQLCQECLMQFPEQSYVFAKASGIPIALFENLKNFKSFRLQRIFNLGRQSG